MPFKALLPSLPHVGPRGPLARCLLESSAELVGHLRAQAAKELAGACAGPLLPEDAVWLRWFRATFDEDRMLDTERGAKRARPDASSSNAAGSSDIRSFFARVASAASHQGAGSVCPKEGAIEAGVPPRLCHPQGGLYVGAAASDLFIPSGGALSAAFLQLAKGGGLTRVFTSSSGILS